MTDVLSLPALPREHLAPGPGGPPFDAPLSEERAARLVAALALAPGHHVLDLGCGRGELLLRVVAAHAASTGTGVDRRRAALDRGRRAAAERGLQERVEFVEGDVSTFDGYGDLVLCVGAAHAWGGATVALRELRHRVEPGGVVLFADGFWQRPAGADARTRFGELPVLDGLLQVARSAGFAVEDAEPSSREEWDRFEEGVRRGLEQSDDPDLRLAAVARGRDYREGYRGVLGFAWLVLSV